jgi:hypothetical protein
LTLIVGINCNDGVVLGADGATTFSTLGRATIRQEAKTKLRLINECVVLGVSGPVGLGQRLAGELQALNITATSYKKEYVAMSTLRGVFWRQMEPEYKIADVTKTVLGPAAQQSVLSESLLALPVDGAPTLLHCDHQASFSVVKSFNTAGSGQGNADPFLAFIRRIFWPDRLPTLAKGIFAALWTLRHAIATSPGGVSGPVQLVILPQGCVARELSADDLEEHEQAIASTEEALARLQESGPISTPPE